MPISEGASLEWRQPSMWHRTYELQADERTVGTLEFASMSGSRAQARIGDRSWTFKRTGFFRTQTTARMESSETDLLVYEPTWRGTGGDLRAANGPSMKLAQANFWATAWELRTAAGEVILSYQNQGALRTGAQVRVAASSPGTPDLDLLICFVWYILVLHMQDAVVAST